MKTIQSLLLLSCITYLSTASAQDTLKNKHTSRYKMGLKYMREQSGNYEYTNLNAPVNSGGIQAIRQLKNSRSSIESGVYLNSRALATYAYNRLYKATYQNISIPLNYRFDTRLFYVSGGPYVEYMAHEDYSKWLYNSVGLKLRRLNAGVNINLGMEKAITRFLSFFVEGRWSQTVTATDFYRDYFIPSYRNYGVGIGVNYKIPVRA